MKQLKESIGAHVIGIWEILKEIGLPQQAKGLEIPVAIHDACGARGDAQTQDIIRELLLDMGCTVEDTEYSRDLSPCCGYGGLTAYANKDMAAKMTEKCLERSDAPYITYCMACRDRFAREEENPDIYLNFCMGQMPAICLISVRNATTGSY